MSFGNALAERVQRALPGIPGISERTMPICIAGPALNGLRQWLATQKVAMIAACPSGIGIHVAAPAIILSRTSPSERRSQTSAPTDDPSREFGHNPNR